MELQQPQFDVRQLAFLALGLLPAAVLPEPASANISGDDVLFCGTADAPHSFQCAPQSLLHPGHDYRRVHVAADSHLLFREGV